MAASPRGRPVFPLLCVSIDTFFDSYAVLISSGDCRPLSAPALCPLALTGTPPEPLSLGQPHWAAAL